MTNESEIIELFFRRDERAIAVLSAEYGDICERVAKNILGGREDAEECVNDAYLALWNRIPPERPKPLRAYLLRVVRNISLAKYHKSSAGKRNSHYDVALHELEDCLAFVDEGDSHELTTHINIFLASQSEQERMLFVRRYWYSDGISELSRRFRMSENAVSVRLSRIRGRLKKFLQKEGYEL